MEIQESGEMYLETILILSKTLSKVRAIDICEHMGYSKPSISRAMGLLKKGNLITVDEGGFINLTESGKAVAEKIYERHNILTLFFKQLGVNEDIALKDACKVEHIISNESFEAIKSHVNK